MADNVDQQPIEETRNGDRDIVLSARDVTVGFGSKVVLDKLNLDIYRGEILGFVGASGTGKSVLMRTVLRLLPRRSGTIKILGQDFDELDEPERVAEAAHRLGLKHVVITSVTRDDRSAASA